MLVIPKQMHGHSQEGLSLPCSQFVSEGKSVF